MKLLTYNIDGLNETLLTIRVQLILSIILSENADVIHLQEVIPEIYAIIRSVMTSNGYVCSDQMMQPYFIMSCVKKEYQANNLRFEVISFANTKSKSDQGRYLLKSSFLASSKEDNIKHPRHMYCFFNAHLESCGIAFKSPSSFIRMAQLEAGFEQLFQSSSNTLSILAGDLNIRDAEANQVLKSFQTQGIDDIIECVYKETSLQDSVRKKRKLTEETEDVLNTWYLPEKRSVKYRFDRVYGNQAIIGTDYHLIGGEEVLADFLDGTETCTYLTPSDHRGIVVNLRPAYSLPVSSSSAIPNNSLVESSQPSLSQSSEVTYNTLKPPVTAEGSCYNNNQEQCLVTIPTHQPNIVQKQSAETEEERKTRVREQRIRVLGGGGALSSTAKVNSDSASGRESEGIPKKLEIETVEAPTGNMKDTKLKTLIIDLT